MQLFERIHCCSKEMQETEPLNGTLEALKELINRELNSCNVSNDSELLTIGRRVLCPNVVMNERHKMARNLPKPLQTKLFPMPAELTFVSAKKAIREENSKALILEKEKKIVTRAILQVEQEFSNRRKSATFSLPDLKKQNKRIDSDVHAVSHKDDKHKHNELSDFLANIQMTYKRLHGNISRVQHFQEPMPHIEQTASQSKINVNNVKLSPVTPKEKSSVDKMNRSVENPVPYDKVNQIKTGEESKVVQTAADECHCETTEETVLETADVNSETNNCIKRFSNSDEQSRKWQLLYCWNVWRRVTLKSKKENCRIIRIQKIDSFLTRLTKTAEQVRRLEKLADSVTSQKITKVSFSRPSKREKTISEVEDIRKLDEIEKELTESAVEACERLQKNLKIFHPNLQPKLRALSVLTSVKNKKNDIGPKRVYPTPAFLLEMESRYNERRKRWENIRKRRSEMEAEKERIIKERQEEEKRMEDLKKREKLEELKEKRRKENEAKEERKREMRKFKQQLKLAEDHYTRYLMKKVGFQPWTKLILLRREQTNGAHHYSQVRTCRRLLMHWRRFTVLQTELKYRKAQKLREKILLKYSFSAWMLEHNEYVMKNQVAMDWAEAKLSEKTFTIWFDNARAERWYFMHKAQLAESFHERKSMWKCLRKWREFPELVRKEREKERRKKLWQRKVQEFLPDYQPAFISEI